jgi:hypothetical protein
MGETKWAVLALLFSVIGIGGLAECGPPAKCELCGSQCRTSMECASGCACLRGAYGMGECVELHERGQQ